ncbi:MAG: 23S rRNA pseudouridine(2605) synthase RluB [Fluviicoccus sp.]|uniref:23S rRNA pseudouridine(2605) synthase RluB n=1 Tax=Fluviicoccus sp. TaxID=2003552 RepID=UPI002727A1A3|nr:23S rRNA pseudouridine(2605) synthase RluB [Fluviicoccus sp.]MDO8331827.1 23S rRNA pseudouridine(2605) synthase RluB [Fluviicoccus sp.]
MSEKLQKVLARVGLGSRRHMEEAISQGRVSVNGRIAELGERIEAGDELRVDGRKVQFSVEEETRRRVLIYYKPEGEICTRHDPEGRPSVFDRLPPLSGDRWVMVGRLDINSTGLLLFTNDGEMANRLMHPSNEVEREYAVRVMGEVTPAVRQQLIDGVQLEDGPAKFESFFEVGGEGINRWYQVVVKEGRNREVRRLFESQGLRVSRLLRIRYGTISLPRQLHTGRWMELDKDEIEGLTALVKLKPRTGTGLYGLAKRRAERMQDKPLPARRGGYLRQQRRDGNSKGEGHEVQTHEQEER